METKFVLALAAMLALFCMHGECSYYIIYKLRFKEMMLVLTFSGVLPNQLSRLRLEIHNNNNVVDNLLR